MSRVESKLWTVHSPLFFRKIIEFEFMLRAAISHECQNYLGAGSLVGGEKNRGTVKTSLQLA